MGTREEQIAEHDAKPFQRNEWDLLEPKCTAIVDDNGAIVEIMVTNPYPPIPMIRTFEMINKSEDNQ